MSLLPLFAALLTSVCWSMNSLWYSIAGKHVSSYTVTHIRLWLSIPFIIILHFFFYGSFYPMGLSSQNLLYLSLSGIIGYVITDLLLFEALVRLGARICMLIMILSPIFSAVISWIFLKEVLQVLHIIAIMITILGVAIVVLEKKEGEKKSQYLIRGIFYALLASFGQALGLVFSKIGMNGNLPALSATYIRLVSGFTTLALITLLRGKLIEDFQKMKNKKAFLLILSGTLLGPVVGVSLSLYAINLIKVGIASTLMSLSPIILLAISSFYYKEKHSFISLFGTFLAILGTSFFFLFK